MAYRYTDAERQRRHSLRTGVPLAAYRRPTPHCVPASHSLARARGCLDACRASSVEGVCETAAAAPSRRTKIGTGITDWQEYRRANRVVCTLVELLASSDVGAAGARMAIENANKRLSLHPITATTFGKE